MNGDVSQTVQTTQINIEKIEIRPWDDKRAISVAVPDILAAFVENAMDGSKPCTAPFTMRSAF